jgi:glutaconate CoA-transferase subunit B
MSTDSSGASVKSRRQSDRSEGRTEDTAQSRKAALDVPGFTVNELMVAELSRHFRDDEIGFVGVGTSGRAFSLVVGIPLAAGRLAQLTSAPRFDLQIGPIIGPHMPELPARWNDSTVYSWAASGLIDGADNLDVFAKGGVDVGFVSGAQVDQYGNLNVTWLNGPGGRRIRLIGCLALPEHQACAKRAVILADLDPKVFVPKVDYISGVGWLEGGRSREEAGISIGGGPQLVVTDKAIFDFATDTRRMRVRSLHPGVSFDDVIAAVGFRPEIPEDVPVTEPPSAEQLRLIRTTIDPDRLLLRHEPRTAGEGRRA